MMASLDLDRAGAFARAFADRVAFVVESLALAVLSIIFVGLAAMRFDLTGAAYVWGLFWMRAAQTEDAVRLPALAVLVLVVAVAAAVVACVRWPKASRAFDAYPPSRRAHRKMMERLG